HDPPGRHDPRHLLLQHHRRGVAGRASQPHLASRAPTPLGAVMRDIFAWIGELDAASLLAVAEAGLAEPASVRRAAEAIVAVRALADAPGSDRPTDYLDIQRLLRAQAGDDADVIHLGRSRQDILATVHRLLLRDRIIVLA